MSISPLAQPFTAHLCQEAKAILNTPEQIMMRMRIRLDTNIK